MQSGERTTPFILASQSPRRRELLLQAGYEFQVVEPSEFAECGVCSGETPPEFVARLAWQKARDVALRTAEGLILGCDTVAECQGRILGKPADVDDAEDMLRWLSGRVHHVFSGICLWRRPDNATWRDVVRTTLRMARISDADLQQYLDSGLWMGKAGAFGYQDELDWIEIEEGSESNVVGLPLEKLTEFWRLASS